MFAVILALIDGVLIITMKFITNAASEKLGLLPGSIINYIVGSIFALALVVVSGGHGLNLVNAKMIPPYLFLGGVFGLLATLISNRTMNKLPVLHTTSLIITAQMLTALVIDMVMFNQFSVLKSLGAVIVIIALIWDQRIIKASA